MQGFSEAFLSEQCVENSHCNDQWFVWTCVAWIGLTSVVIIVLKDIKMLFADFPQNLISFHQKYKECSQSSSETSDTENTEQTQSTKKKLSDYKISIEKLNIFAKESSETKHKGIFEVSKMHEFFVDDEKSGNLKYLQILLFYIQDISLLQVAVSSPVVDEGISIPECLTQISELAVDLIQFGKSICFWSGVTPVQKLVLKMFLGPSILFLFGAMYFIFFMTSKFVKERANMKKHVYNRLTSATVFVLLLFYQKIAKSTLSLIHCVQVGDRYVLLLDGTVSCYQTWQIGVFAFLLTWVIPFMLVLTIGPGLLSDNRISAHEFLVSCSLPVPILLWWSYKRHRNQWHKTVRLVTPWHAELIEDLQKSFKKISVTGIGPLCWTGVIKCRRLVLVLMYTFISNLVLRLSAMTMFTLAMLPLHIKVSPYKDKRANQVFSFSLCATIFLGLLNLIKAMAVEGLVDYGTVRSILEACDTLTDSILLWCPLTVILVYALFLVLKKVFSKRKAKDCCSKYFRKSSTLENIELQERDKNKQSNKRSDSI